MLPRLLTATMLLFLAAAAPAFAAEPILPLSEVQPGMRCTGLSVAQGTTISSFDVEIVDVVAGDPISDQPLLLVRVSGDAIAPYGIAEGYSGSPVVCGGRVAGALAYGTGDFGNELGFATPIEAMLGQPVPPPPALRRAPALLRRARALTPPLAISGIQPRVFAPFARAAAQVGIRLTAVPAAPTDSRFPVQQLVPGSAVAVGLSSGDVTGGAIGTVTYVDGDKVYAFGHPFSGTGRRSLLLQDAYIYAVVDNPLGIDGAVSTKLGAAGHDLGTLTYDGRDGVAGVVGALPPRTALNITTRDVDTGAVRANHVRVADETAVGLPDGASPVLLVAPMALAQAAYTALDGGPVLQSARMCARFTITELKQPARFCRRYVGAYGGDQSGSSGPFIADLGTALSSIDLFASGEPHLTSVDVSLNVEAGLQQALLRGVRGPRTLRRGETTTVRLALQRYRGERFTKTVKLRVPRDAPLGRRAVVLTGTGLDGGVGAEEIEIVLGGDEEDGGDAGPKTFAALGEEIERLAGWDGVRMRFRRTDARRGGTDPVRFYRDPDVRISGSASFRARVVR